MVQALLFIRNIADRFSPIPAWSTNLSPNLDLLFRLILLPNFSLRVTFSLEILFIGKFTCYVLRFNSLEPFLCHRIKLEWHNFSASYKFEVRYVRTCEISKVSCLIFPALMGCKLAGRIQTLFYSEVL